MNLSTRDLEQALSIRRKIDALQRRLNSLVGRPGASVTTSSSKLTGGRRGLSAAARTKFAAAARARWARFRAGKAETAKTRRGGITASGRRRLSQLMKARWAARRKMQGKKK